MASIVVDDTSSQFTYGGSQWAEVPAPHFYGGSATFPPYAQDASSGFIGYGTFNFGFEGTSVAFTGNTPLQTDSQWVMVSIDGGTPYNSSYMDPSPPSCRQWYQSPNLSDGKHNIAITHIAATSVDYAVVTAGPSTNLIGTTLIVDDGDPAIAYQGSWTRSNSQWTSTDSPYIGLPYGNGTHRTTSAGASASFTFTGTDITVYGLVTWNVLGTISVKFTIDGVSSTQDYAVTTSTQQYTSGAKQQNNFILYAKNSLSAGQHTLGMQVVNAGNQIFEIDYITYTPSSNTLTQKPATPIVSTTNPSTSIGPSTNSSSTNSSLSSFNSSSTGSSTLSTSASSTTPGHSSLLPAGQLSSSHTSTSSTSTAAAGSVNAVANKSIPVAAIIGGAVGGLVLLVLLLLLLLLCRKRRSNRSTSGATPSMTSFGTPGPLTLRPFTVHSPSEARDTPLTEIPMESAKLLISRKGALSTMYTPLSQTMPRAAESPASSTRVDGDLYGRIDRLQALFEELQREVAAGGGKGSDEGVRAAELRGRIADLMREEGTISTTSGGRRTTLRSTLLMSDIGTLPPPAYEQG